MVWFLGGAVWIQELNLLILTGPFQFGILYDSILQLNFQLCKIKSPNLYYKN